MQVFIYTPVFKEGVQKDGMTVYAFNQRNAFKVLLQYYDISDLEDVELLGETTTDDQDYIDFLNFEN